jgi:hypothetical protein
MISLVIEFPLPLALSNTTFTSIAWVLLRKSGIVPSNLQSWSPRQSGASVTSSHGKIYLDKTKYLFLLHSQQSRRAQIAGVISAACCTEAYECIMGERIR